MNNIVVIFTLKSMLFDFYKLAKEVALDTHALLNRVRHDGKDYLGEVFVQDSYGCLWKIKVRYTGNRKRYLKISSQSGKSRHIRASADNHKPGEYLQIAPNEWESFYRLANNEQQFYKCTQNILDRLVR
ncbi:hypothetical protein I8751_04745 [Nostocaceae cyanobacterium CENA357]|uniref:Uncharacterized protein n=1 Tax=Atlanticothrix silvestris CENA357 TaxID=1725252 RepID=A0A8J7KYY0_9CYAN|nr:hypothetical protein [Atlanticothrix silvestris]MBH8551694.1 hypothetical protein [Atlanticothrix silvestris CENA357]